MVYHLENYHRSPAEERQGMQLAASLRVYSLKGDICENTIEDDSRGGFASCVLAMDHAACRCLRYAPLS